jgi:hypothetical protein
VTRLAGKLFGLRLRLLWLRHSYRFRWAHRPLCDRFSQGILRIGQVRLCRSCACAYGGILFGLAFCLLNDALRESTIPLLLGLIIPTIGLSTPTLYKRLPRAVQDMLRFSMGLCITLSACGLFMGNTLIPTVCAATLFLFWRIYFAMRRKRKAEACNGCPEYGQKGICTGCRLQADAMRAYETEATALLLASGSAPKLPASTHAVEPIAEAEG